MPAIDTPLAYADGSMYVILANIGRNAQREWHWGIYLCLSDPWGQVYNVTDSNNKWHYDEYMTETIASLRTIMTALEIARGLTESQIEAIHNILREVPVMENGGYVPRWGVNFTCRVWVKDTLDALRSAGWIHNVDVEVIEDEAKRGASAAVSTAERRVYVSSALVYN
jgi:hypothetical protein